MSILRAFDADERIKTPSQDVDLRIFFEGLFPPECRKRLLVMFRAYFDASKTFPNVSAVPCLTVAGFVGEVKAWSQFQRKWREVRRKSGIEYFHMADFEARQWPYDTWSERKA